MPVKKRLFPFFSIALLQMHQIVWQEHRYPQNCGQTLACRKGKFFLAYHVCSFTWKYLTANHFVSSEALFLCNSIGKGKKTPNLQSSKQPPCIPEISLQAALIWMLMIQMLLLNVQFSNNVFLNLARWQTDITLNFCCLWYACYTLQVWFMQSVSSIKQRQETLIFWTASAWAAKEFGFVFFYPSASLGWDATRSRDPYCAKWGRFPTIYLFMDLVRTCGSSPHFYATYRT